jgi:hypothetical protein
LSQLYQPYLFVDSAFLDIDAMVNELMRANTQKVKAPFTSLILCYTGLSESMASVPFLSYAVLVIN